MSEAMNARKLLLQALAKSTEILACIPEMNRECQKYGTPELDCEPLRSYQILMHNAIAKLDGEATLEPVASEVRQAIRNYFMFLVEFQEWIEQRELRRNENAN